MFKPGVAELKADKKPAKRPVRKITGPLVPPVSASQAPAISRLDGGRSPSRAPSRADPARVIYWPEEGLLAVADLHLEKGSSFARRGTLLPPYDTAETLARLARLIARHAPRTVVALGDNFHDGRGPARLRAAAIAPRSSRCSAAATGSGSPATTIPIPPQGSAGLSRDPELGALDLSPRAGQESAGTARSRAICIRSRGCRGAAARSAAAASRATEAVW